VKSYGGSGDIEVSDQLHVPTALPPGAKHPWSGDWVGPKVGLDELEKQKIFCLYQESNPKYARSIQLRREPMVGSCEKDTESWEFIKVGHFFA
jgi:hypothetical protein